MEKINREELRQSLVDFLKKNGVKSRFIANAIGLDETVLSRFKSGTRDLLEYTARDLKIWLDNHSGI